MRESRLGVSFLPAVGADDAPAAVRGWFAVVLALVLALAAPTPANAQYDITAHDDIWLTADDSSFQNGQESSTNNTISLTASGLWTVYVCSLDADLGQSNDGQYTKPLSHLKWKRSEQPGWNTMTTSDVFVRTGPGGNRSFDVDYRFTLTWGQDRPGTYGADIQYTITAS